MKKMITDAALFGGIMMAAVIVFLYIGALFLNLLGGV